MTSFPLRLRASLSEQLAACDCDEDYLCISCSRERRAEDLISRWRTIRLNWAIKKARALLRAKPHSNAERAAERELSRVPSDVADRAFEYAYGWSFKFAFWDGVRHESRGGPSHPLGHRWHLVQRREARDRAFDSKGVSL